MRTQANIKKYGSQNNIEAPAEIIVTGRKETYAKDKASGTPNILIDDRPSQYKKLAGRWRIWNIISSKQRSIKQNTERTGRIWESLKELTEHTQQAKYLRHHKSYNES